MDTLTRRDIAEKLSAEHGLTMLRATALVDHVMDLMAEHLSQVGAIEIRGFGSFTPTVRKARRYWNVNRGEWVISQPKRRVRFNISKQVQSRLDLFRI